MIDYSYLEDASPKQIAVIDDIRRAIFRHQGAGIPLDYFEMLKAVYLAYEAGTWSVAKPAPVFNGARIMGELSGTLDWIAQTVHRAHHEGPLETCEKSTCQAARDVLARTGIT